MLFPGCKNSCNKPDRRRKQGICHQPETSCKNPSYRYGICFRCSQRALDLAVDYAQQRVTFGKPIASRQAIKFKLADMEIRLQTARAQLFYNAQLIDKGIYDGMLGSVTKTCVSEMVFDVANQALQIFGGYGYSREYPVEKLLRDARIFSLFEGTNEIQRMIIGGTLVPKKRN